MGVDPARSEAFWLAVRGNCDRVSDASGWWGIVADGPAPEGAPAPEDLDFVRQAFDLLPGEPWGDDVYGAWIGRVKAATGRKGKALFLPLRLALTGRPSGPELADLLPLLGRAGTLARRP